jgi:hypothetical protein
VYKSKKREKFGTETVLALTAGYNDLHPYPLDLLFSRFRLIDSCWHGQILHFIEHYYHSYILSTTYLQTFLGLTNSAATRRSISYCFTSASRYTTRRLSLT